MSKTGAVGDSRSAGASGLVGKTEQVSERTGPRARDKQPGPKARTMHTEAETNKPLGKVEPPSTDPATHLQPKATGNGGGGSRGVTVRPNSQGKVRAARNEVSVSAGRPSIALGGDRKVAKDEPVAIPITIASAGPPNELDATVSLTKDGKDVPFELTRRDGVPEELRFTPQAEGKYVLTVTAKQRGADPEQEATESITIEAVDPREIYLSTPTWRRENEYSSGKKDGKPVLEEKTPMRYILPGAKLLKTDAHRLWVTGLYPYEAGKGPNAPGSPGTATNDSFDMSVNYEALAEWANRFDSLGLGQSFASTVTAKLKNSHLHSNVNTTSATNAWYSMSTGQLTFGTSSGKWDLASDQDVVLHECGHLILDNLAPDIEYAGWAGAVHEGFGDAHAAFLNRDAELSEDFGKLSGTPGTPLRTANNTLRMQDTSSEVHSRGQVFAGLMWQTAEHLHAALNNGRARDQAKDGVKDKEPLDERAADIGLRILYTFPQYLGTKKPTPADTHRALQQAIDTLEKKNLLEGLSDEQVKELKAFVTQQAVTRGLITATNQGAQNGSATPIAGVNPVQEALKVAGLDPASYTARKLTTTPSTGGEAITRYQIFRKTSVAGKAQLVPVDDDYITITEDGGKFRAQVGTLPELGGGSGGARIVQASAGMRSSGSGLPDLGRARKAFQDAAAAHVENLAADPDPGGGAAVVLAAMPGGDRGVQRPARPRESERLVELAKHARGRIDDAKAELVWHEGKLLMQLHLDTLVYEIEVNPDGTTGELQWRVGVIDEQLEPNG